MIWAMLSKTWTWGVILVFVACVAWWFVDPVGFSHNSVFTYLKQLGLGLPGYSR
jgi:hypothetical protein